MDNSWFAIRTKSNREASVAESLGGKGFEVLYPHYKTPVTRSPDLQKQPVFQKPLFPGYLFARFDVTTRLPILTVPGVVNIVSSGRTPIPLDDIEIESLKVLMESALPIDAHPYLRVGDKVVISEGPLNGASGYIVQTDNRRLVVSITLLQRSVAVDVAGEWLEKIQSGDAAPKHLSRSSRSAMSPARRAASTACA
jgi:transcription antitermination factor NusG